MPSSEKEPRSQSAGDATDAFYATHLQVAVIEYQLAAQRLAAFEDLLQIPHSKSNLPKRREKARKM